MTINKLEQQIKDGKYDSISLEQKNGYWEAICFKFNGKTNTIKSKKFKTMEITKEQINKINLFPNDLKNGTYYIEKNYSSLKNKYINIYFAD